MILPAGNGYSVNIGQPENTGDVWTVRLFKKVLLFKRRVSSDWFLNEQQAMKFGEQLARDLTRGDSLEAIRSRRPGWVLHTPPR